MRTRVPIRSLRDLDEVLFVDEFSAIRMIADEHGCSVIRVRPGARLALLLGCVPGVMILFSLREHDLPWLEVVFWLALYLSSVWLASSLLRSWTRGLDRGSAIRFDRVASELKVVETNESLPLSTIVGFYVLTRWQRNPNPSHFYSHGIFSEVSIITDYGEQRERSHLFTGNVFQARCVARFMSANTGKPVMSKRDCMPIVAD